MSKHRKVRDLRFSKTLNLIATASEDSTMKIWDTENMDVLSVVNLGAVKDVLAVHINEDKQIISTACQNFTFLHDVRDPNRVIFKIPSNDGRWGVRSLDWLSSNVISIGGAVGRLSFFDLRTMTYLEHNSGKLWLQSGQGYIEHSDIYRNHFARQEVANAVYAHQLSPSKSKILIAGGPLMSGLKGR